MSNPLKSTLHFQPHDRSIVARNGTTILAAARLAKVMLQSKCGGRGACTACKVQIRTEAQPAPLTRMEKHMLSEQMIKDGYRLGCQCVVNGDADVIVPEDPLRRTIRLQLEAARREAEEKKEK